MVAATDGGGAEGPFNPERLKELNAPGALALAFVGPFPGVPYGVVGGTKFVLVLTTGRGAGVRTGTISFILWGFRTPVREVGYLRTGFGLRKKHLTSLTHFNLRFLVVPKPSHVGVLVADDSNSGLGVHEVLGGIQGVVVNVINRLPVCFSQYFFL